MVVQPEPTGFGMIEREMVYDAIAQGEEKTLPRVGSEPILPNGFDAVAWDTSGAWGYRLGSYSCGVECCGTMIDLEFFKP